MPETPSQPPSGHSSVSEAVRVPNGRGVESSVILAVSEEERDKLTEYLEDGMSLQQALDRISNKSATVFDRALGVTQIANPFSSS